MSSHSYDAMRDGIIYHPGFQRACYRYAHESGSSEAIALAVLTAVGFPDLYIDALRYRWLRQRSLENIEPSSPVVIMSPTIELLSGADLDGALDDAMNAIVDLPSEGGDHG